MEKTDIQDYRPSGRLRSRVLQVSSFSGAVGIERKRVNNFLSWSISGRIILDSYYYYNFFSCHLVIANSLLNISYYVALIRRFWCHRLHSFLCPRAYWCLNDIPHSLCCFLFFVARVDRRSKHTLTKCSFRLYASLPLHAPSHLQEHILFVAVLPMHHPCTSVLPSFILFFHDLFQIRL